MAAFPLLPCDPGVLKLRLYDKHRVDVPIIEWPAPLASPPPVLAPLRQDWAGALREHREEYTSLEL